MDPQYHWVVTAGLVTSSVIALIANSFLLVIFCRRRGLRTVPNRFVINLLITNLLSSLLLIPLFLSDSDDTITRAINATKQTNSSSDFSATPSKENLLLDITSPATNVSSSLSHSLLTSTFINKTTRKCLCYLAQSSTMFVCTATILSILLVGINQYFGVIHSLRYHFYINKCKSMIMILSSWFLAFLFSLLGSLTQSDSNLWHFCEKMPSKYPSFRVLNTTYAIIYFVTVILVPFIAISVIYVCIYKAAHQNSERMRKSTSASCNLDTYIQLSAGTDKAVSHEDNLQLNETLSVKMPKVQSAPDFLRLESEQSESDKPADKEKATKVVRASSDRTSILTSIKHKISNASVFRYREETRAAKISFIVIFMVLICYIPYGVTVVLNAKAVRVEVPDSLNYISIGLLIISTAISPFLFAYRNRRVRREIVKLLGFKKSRSNAQNNQDNQIKTRNLELNNFTVNNVIGNFEPNTTNEPFLYNNYIVPEVIVTCKIETEKKSILKRVCSSSNWTGYKKCNFITVPDSCISAEARGSFSSASTQISSASDG